MTDDVMPIIEEKAVPAKAQKKQTKYIRTAKGKKRTVKQVPRGRAYIYASLNNTIITVTDPNGNTLAWATAGNCGFKGPKKATPYAASIVVNKIVDKIEPLGVKEVHLIVKGIGSGRDSAIRSLNSKGINILSIKEVTPLAHNGCRAPRQRRV
ncbi:MAG: 30S ribosomal protein S11 [Candidatus Uhrbacteria bacterium]|nr:30S ribosomal protein S11 [Candidatus Uhrbacteria bacterium]